jgi:hypothetical protein
MKTSRKANARRPSKPRMREVVSLDRLALLGKRPVRQPIAAVGAAALLEYITTEPITELIELGDTL